MLKERSGMTAVSFLVSVMTLRLASTSVLKSEFFLTFHFGF